MTPIAGFPGYFITPSGEVHSVLSHGPAVSRINNKNRTLARRKWAGYWTVSLQKGRKAVQKWVHRLVAEAFIPNPMNKPQVNHKDGNPSNSDVSNLEWVTASENHIHRCKVLGRYPKTQTNPPYGERHGLSKLKEKDVRQIYKLLDEGITQTDIGRLYKVHKSNISYIARGVTWPHLYKNRKKP
jgi:hypothetical protein